jgi:hypothetical protein
MDRRKQFNLVYEYEWWHSLIDLGKLVQHCPQIRNKAILEAAESAVHLVTGLMPDV